MPGDIREGSGQRICEECAQSDVQLWWVSSHLLSKLLLSGMNNYSGQFAFKVGLPAKSGVSGIILVSTFTAKRLLNAQFCEMSTFWSLIISSILVIVPNVMGFATWSPPLDAKGNSARGIMFFQELVKVYR